MDEMQSSCYPEQGKWLAQRLSAPTPAPVQPGRYDVALWRSWPPRELAIVADGVVAENGFEAIEQVMRQHQWRVAAHASACLVGGMQVYRAFGIEIPKKRQPAESEVLP